MDLTPEDIYDALGDVNDHVVARLLESGASRAELRQAIAVTQTEDLWCDGQQPAPSHRVEYLCAILYDLLQQEVDDSDWERMSPSHV